MKANKLTVKNLLIKNYERIYNRFLRSSIFSKYFPFPLVDNLISEVTEYLQIEKSEFISSINSFKYDEIYNGYKTDYENWLKTSLYYFYDLVRWHRVEKITFITDWVRQHFEPRNLEILDLGAGIGTRALIYAKRNNVTLVEINERLLDFSQWRFQKYNLKGEFCSEIPAGKEYDIIMVLDVIGHLTDPKNTLSRICSSLKKNGFLRITFDNSTESSKGGVHRNKEIDFRKLILKNGLKKSFSTHYVKL